MQKLYSAFFFFVLFITQITIAQQPSKPNAVEIYNQIKKLNFLGSVLYIAAHPDDENTRLISYLSNHVKARTGYLSLTRGDGGQNLIGPELRELLGVIRTQELIEARKIDGGEQFFSRANDFGYSKNPNETLQIWDKNEVLSDVVYIVRKFQPDIIINRFDARSPGTTHGHHTASALLSIEAFDLSNEKNAFPNQFKLVSPWQAKRLLFNTSWWFYGSKEKFEKADKSNLLQIQTGVYYQELGKSNQEIAALSRSSHQSQGFGSTGSRGEEIEYLELLKGELPAEKSNLFEGIDTSWNRIDGGKPIGELLTQVINDFDFKNPQASIPDLLKAYILMQAINENHWIPIKLEEIKNIIAACSGLFIEAVAENQQNIIENLIKVKAEVINRSDLPMIVESIDVYPNGKNQTLNLDLKNNVNKNFNLEINTQVNTDYTQPYWLKEKGTIGMYKVENQENIGIPDIIREVKVTFNIKINGVLLPFEKIVVYKYNDDVKGEVYKPLDLVPKVTTAIKNKVNLFDKQKPKLIEVMVKAGTENINGNLKLVLPEDWQVKPEIISFKLNKKGEEQSFNFIVSPPKKATEVLAQSIAIIDEVTYDKEQIIINYNHIAPQQILKQSEAKFINFDIKIENQKIAYIMGAGDEVPASLAQMGYQVSIIKPEEITKQKIEQFNVVITGIRAYNMIPALGLKQDILLDFVKEGHTMIVQYNTLDDLVTNEIAPYPLKLSRDRVTDENATVLFLDPNQRVLNYPNKITTKDFEGWKQEQGLYYPNEWDKAFVPILASNDKGESLKKGALLIANYGKGHYIYTALSFFRELPEGVPGAYRLIANLISIQ